jgi:hypothetical protein
VHRPFSSKDELFGAIFAHLLVRAQQVTGYGSNAGKPLEFHSARWTTAIADHHPFFPTRLAAAQNKKPPPHLVTSRTVRRLTARAGIPQPIILNRPYVQRIEPTRRVSMGRIFVILAVAAFAATLVASPALAGDKGANSHQFQWFRDADGDGIPNGLDDDWAGPADGTGFNMKHCFGIGFTVPLWAFGDSGSLVKAEYRHRKNQPGPTDDQPRTRLQLRDGSCQ